MFDGRETLVPLNNAQTFQNNLTSTSPIRRCRPWWPTLKAFRRTAEQLSEIVQFELGFSTAQIRDDDAGPLHGHGATGGPLALSAQNYYPGENDVLGADPKGEKFDSNVFSLYTAWETSNHHYDDKEKSEAREEIAAGEKLFNTLPLIDYWSSRAE